MNNSTVVAVAALTLFAGIVIGVAIANQAPEVHYHTHLPPEPQKSLAGRFADEFAGELGRGAAKLATVAIGARLGAPTV